MDPGVVGGGPYARYTRCRGLHRDGDRSGVHPGRAPSGRLACAASIMSASIAAIACVPAGAARRRLGKPSNACITTGNTISTVRITAFPISTPSLRVRPIMGSPRSSAKVGQLRVVQHESRRRAAGGILDPIPDAPRPVSFRTHGADPRHHRRVGLQLEGLGRRVQRELSRPGHSSAAALASA
jgi:hypothetical protein